jgi:NAD(P)-dependent dehydrogenase (short-subunit alcohol dehydrogenase family)
VDTQFDGRVAIVTGAASGIGRAIADQLATEGAAVIYADRDTERGAEAAAGEGSSFAALDVSDPASVEALFASIAEVHGGVDIVVNVAGVQRAGNVTELSVEDWDLMMAVNARGCFLIAKYATPLLRGRPAPVIVNVSSGAGLRGHGGMTGYSASKGAIIAFDQALAHELGADGIRVMTLCPGWTDTPFNDPVTAQMGGRAAIEELVAGMVPLRRQSSPEEMARAAVFLVSDAASYMTGSNLVVDGGLTS